MADETNGTVSITMGTEGQKVETDDTTTVSSDGIQKVGDEDAQDELETSTNDNGASDDDASADADEEDRSGEDEESDEVDEDLGDFDEENIEAWDAKYRSEDGDLRQDVLTEEFFKNEGKGLNEATYDYLAKAGIPKSMAKDIEAALMTRHEADRSKQDAVVFEAAQSFVGEGVDGTEVLRQAIEWGKSGGYTDGQKERFNSIMNGTDVDAKTEATELLLSRFTKANPTKTEKPKLPKRDISKKSQKASGTKPFASRDEYREFQRVNKDNPTALREGARRWQASQSK